MKLTGFICRTLFVTVFVLGSIPRLFAFGQEGHEAVAILALQKLHADSDANNPKAKAALNNIKKLLGTEDMASVAVWADWVRLRETNHLDKTAIADIDARFPGNGDWHFVDLPLGTTAYTTGGYAANDNDVVHGINNCITMLESADTSAQKDHHVVALKFLIHLVGDIHQPLHVACGYYRWGSSSIIHDPATISVNKLPDDRGGNHLLVKPGSSDELHAIWDGDLVVAQTTHHSTATGADVAQALSADLTTNLFPAATSDHTNWAAQWANDSTKAANLAYVGIKVPAIQMPGPHLTKTEIPKTAMKNFDKAAYINAHQVAARQQLLKAGWRLAELLENINWHN